MIRPAKSSDCKVLIDLIEQLGYSLTESEMLQRIRLFSTLEDYRILVAEENGEVVGLIALVHFHCFHKPGSYVRIISLVVDREKKRKGIGTDLLAAAETFAKEEGAFHIELTSGVHRKEIGAHDFYRKHGFVELNKQKMYFGKLL